MKLLFIISAFLAVTYCKKIPLPGENAMDIIDRINSQRASRFSNKDELFEGDILVSRKMKSFVNKLKKKEAITTSKFDAIRGGAWPGAIVYYSDRSLPQRGKNAVAAAIAEYQAKTCIRFRRAGRSTRSYLNFFVGGGCYSMIGRQGGAQRVSLAGGCQTKGIAIHEIMHALGFFHEQSRRDRDRYIRINWGNIPQRVRYNFEMYRSGQASTLDERYDKKSVMHYGNYAFSNNRQKTIVSLANPGETLGQRYGLSNIDVRQLNKYYKCKTTTTSTTKKPVVTSRPPTGNCEDTYDLCTKMAQVGLCKVGVDWVKTSCQKSCNNCPTKPKCKEPSRHCDAWKKLNYCNNRKYAVWMGNNCSNCGKCI